MSTIQFSFTLAAKRSLTSDLFKNESFLNKGIDVVFGTEIWSLFLVFLTQDFPFFILRVMILANHDLTKNYMILFLVSKNFILLILEIYRIYAIYVEEKENRIEPHKIDNQMEYKKMENFVENTDLKQRKPSFKNEEDTLFSKKKINKL